MNTNLDKLEFNKILENLQNYCVTFSGKELAKNLYPSNFVNDVKKLLNETEEATILIARNSTPSFYDYSPISIDLKNLENSNSLSIKSLINLNKIF
ncbi:MAG: hypothetical protein HUJ68_04385, partial [Clostridia bacterium]|nr:hypothetical protein [Clostridia bacterium]